MELELAHVIKQKLQYAVKCHGLPRLLQSLHRVVFQLAESKFAIRFALWPLQAIQALKAVCALKHPFIS